jgi:hypothetical protein
MTKWIEFNVHNRLRIRIDENTPTASLFVDMLRPFMTQDSQEQADLTITGDMEPLENAVYGEVHGQSEFKYTEKGLHIESADSQIIADGDGFRVHGKQELLVVVLPLIDRIMVKRNAAMIHALTVDYRGQGLAMPAWGGVGKTSTMSKLLKMDNVSFMGDDWAFLSSDQRLLGYAKPMFIKPYHAPLYPHLFEKRHKPLVPNRLSKSIHSFTTRIHPIITKYPKLAEVARRYSPEHMMVTPDKAFPHASVSTEAPLALSVFVERYDGSAPLLHEKSKEWMISRLIGNFHSELTRHSKLVIAALAAAGLEPLEVTFGQKADVLNQALDNKPTYLYQVPKSYPPDQASDVIVETLQALMAKVPANPAEEQQYSYA